MSTDLSIKFYGKNGPGIFDDSADLADWRTMTRLFLYYKSFCRFDGIKELTTKHLTFFGDHVQLTFPRAKNDQFYSSTVCVLSFLPEAVAYCPGVILKTYFKVMGFTTEGTEYINCRVLKSKGIYRAKPSEQLSYTISLKNTKELLTRFGFKGNFSEKSLKVSGEKSCTLPFC